VKPVTDLTKELQTLKKSSYERTATNKAVWSSGAVASVLEVNNKLGSSRSTGLTLVQEPAILEGKQEAINYKMFKQKRKAWLNKNGSGINEVDALKNIFYSFLLSQKREKGANSRKLITLHFKIRSMNPFYTRDFRKKKVASLKQSELEDKELEPNKRTHSTSLG
jgi:hypothetical protein